MSKKLAIYFILALLVMLDSPVLMAGAWVGKCHNFRTINGGSISFSGCEEKTMFKSESGNMSGGHEDVVAICHSSGTMTQASFLVYKSEWGTTNGKGSSTGWWLGKSCIFKNNNWACKSKSKLPKKFDLVASDDDDSNDCVSDDDVLELTNVK